jgi:hypothetical protein
MLACNVGFFNFSVINSFEENGQVAFVEELIN